MNINLVKLSIWSTQFTGLPKIRQFLKIWKLQFGQNMTQEKCNLNKLEKQIWSLNKNH